MSRKWKVHVLLSVCPNFRKPFKNGFYIQYTLAKNQQKLIPVNFNNKVKGGSGVHKNMIQGLPKTKQEISNGENPYWLTSSILGESLAWFNKYPTGIQKTTVIQK